VLNRFKILEELVTSVASNDKESGKLKIGCNKKMKSISMSSLAQFKQNNQRFVLFPPQLISTVIYFVSSVSKYAG